VGFCGFFMTKETLLQTLSLFGNSLNKNTTEARNTWGQNEG
jgi:hypothetical protein